MEQVFRHELVHAWLEVRNPRRRTAMSREHHLSFLTSPGQWCVEGFPAFLQEQSIERTTGDLAENKTSFTLDFVAHAEPLLPWQVVLAVPRGRQTEQGLFETWKADLVLAAQRAGWTEFPNAKLKTYVGVHVAFDPIRVFYRQAAAACHYLFFAENGRHRPKLLDFISNYYSGESPESLDFAAVFGLDPEEIGSRILAYAKSKLGG